MKVVFLVVEDNGRPVIDKIFACQDGETECSESRPGSVPAATTVTELCRCGA